MKATLLFLISVLIFNFNLIAQETEPNDLPSQANTILLDVPMTGQTSTGDVADYFLLDIPHGGVLQIDIIKNPQFCGVWWIYILDAESGNEEEVGKANMYWLDAINSFSRKVLKGMYYIKIADAAATTNYTLTLTLHPIPIPEDVEPNNSESEAIVTSPMDTFTGTIRYYNPGLGIDEEDWYRIEMNQPGVLHYTISEDPESWQAWRAHLYDGESADRDQIRNVDLYWNSGINSMSAPLLSGTYYMKIGDASAWVNYKFSPSLTSPAWSEDLEPNNDTLTAFPLPFNDSLTGLLRYWDPGYGNDFEDWYAIEIDESGLLKLDIYNANNTANFWVYLLDGNQPDLPLIKKVQFYWLNGNIHKSLNQFLDPGKYYLKLADADRNFAYQIKTQFIPAPKAEFSFTNVFSTYNFNNLSENAENYLWEFGDGQTSEAKHPLHNFETPGVFDVCLSAYNETGVDSSCATITILGVDRIFPEQGGNIGEVTIGVFGGGLDSFFTISLHKDGILTSTSERTWRDSRNSLSGRLDLFEIPLGFYDVVIEKEGFARYEIENGFEVVEGIAADPWVRVVGRDRFLFNTWSTYTIEIGNNGNVDALMVPVWLLFEDVQGLEMKFGNPTQLSLDDSGTYSLNEQVFTVLDTSEGMPFNSRIYGYLIPKIRPGQTYSYKIKIKAPEDITIMSWTETPFFRRIQDPEKVNSNWSSVLSNNKTKCVAQALAEKGYNEEDVQIVQFDCAFNKIGGYLIYGINRDEKDKLVGFLPRLKPFVYHIVKVLRECGIQDKELAKSITEAFIKHYMYLYAEIIHPVKKAKNNIAKPAMAINLDSIDISTCNKECQARNMNAQEFKAVNSVDPNEKVGPVGFQEENYFNKVSHIPYTILFENKDSASAPAHVVRIIDTLDKSKYDLNTFAFGPIGIGDSLWYPEAGLNNYIADFEINHLNVTARVNASLDKTSGIVEWLISSLDPISLTIIEDPDIGFLPPNVERPEGEGSVSFNIRAIKDLSHQDEINNKAAIFFDANNPIITNVHRLTLDQIAPTSHVLPLPLEMDSSSFEVSWTGTDDGSGIATYDVYVAADNDTFALWKVGTTDTSAIFEGEYETSYSFYSIARDWVGNTEEAPNQADATTTVLVSTTKVLRLESLSIQPNPTDDQLVISFISEKSGDLQINIRNALGQHIKTFFSGKISVGENRFENRVADLPQGIYVLQFEMDGAQTNKMITVMK